MPSFKPRDVVRDEKRDVADELRFHLEMRTEELIAMGMDREEAARRAAESFGDVHAVEQECRVVREERTRERRRREWFSELRSDIVYAARSLRRSKTFTVTAILTLALGVGGAIAGFTLVNGVLLRPLPYKEPERLAMVWMTGELNGKMETQFPMSIANFIDIRERVEAVSGMAAFRSWSFALRGDGATGSENIAGARVTPELFDVLGVQPMLGRGFIESDGKAGSERVAVISEELWRRRFESSSAVVGKRVTLSGEDVTIIGVMPAGFSFPRGAELPNALRFPERTELWMPLIPSERELLQRGTGNTSAIARLAPGIPLETARADLTRVIGQIIEEYPRYFLPRSGLTTLSLAEQAAAPVRRSLLLLMAAAGVILLIALFNITNLLAARASSRDHELAIRRALGASRMRIVRQLVTENALLAAVGSLVGFGIAALTTRALIAVMPAGLPRGDDIVIDWRVIAATLVAAALAAILFSVMSVLHSSSDGAEVVQATRRSTTSPRKRTFRQGLVIVEVALSLVLLVSSALLMQSYMRITNVPTGMQPAGALTASVLLPFPGGFNQQRYGPEWISFFSEFERRLTSAPEVAAAGGISSLPLTGAFESTTFRISDAPPVADGPPPPSADYQVVTPGWFNAAGVRVLAGRQFDQRDGSDGVPAVMVSAELARSHWPSVPLTSVVGRQIGSGLVQGQQTIIGIVDDVRRAGLDAPVRPTLYLPQAQFPYPFLTFVVKANAGQDATSLAPVMRRELAAINPSLALDNVRTLESVVDESVSRQRFGMMLAGTFAIVALFLATVGLYGVIAAGVAQRTREIGVRIALGATQTDVLTAMMREGTRITVVGVLIGVASAVGATRLLQDQLYEVRSTDVAIYAAVALFTAAVALVATMVPAWKATQLEPTKALRAD